MTQAPCTWPYPGSRWWKFDFHTHTPASNDTTAWQGAVGKPDEVTPEKWLLRYMAAEIDCVAVTDHNSGAWIDRLKTTYAKMKATADTGSPPAGFREITVFPGVEISVHGGIHMLAILDPSSSTSDIDTLLGQVDYQGTKGDSDGVTWKGVADVIQTILDAGGIPIPAHADDEKGLLAVNPETRECRHDANTVLQSLQIDGLLAVEWLDPSAPFPSHVEKLASRLTRILGGDSSSFQGGAVPGGRYTWVKMARPTLEGVRLALLDGNEVSVRRSDDGVFDPLWTPTHFIRGIEVQQARVMGNRRPERLELSPYYNVLIGGRGTGKSTIVHALRLAYGRGEELQRLSVGSDPQQQFERFIRQSKGRDDGGLRDETEIYAEMMRDGVPQRLQWRSGVLTVEDQDAAGQWKESSSQVISPERFPIRLFSQGQIAAMAGENRQALLDVIDETADVKPLKDAFEEAKRTFFAQRARLRELEGRLAVRPEVARKLTDLNRKLEALSQAHHPEVLKAYGQAQRQQREVEQTLEQLGAMPDSIEGLTRDLLLDDWPVDLFSQETDADVLAWRGDVEQAIDQVCATLKDAVAALQQRSEALHEDDRLKAWLARVKETRKAYEDLQTALAAQGESDPQAFGRLVQERQELEAQLKLLDQMQADFGLLQIDTEVQRRRVSEARTAITRARELFLQVTLHGNPFVRMEVVLFGFEARTIEQSLRVLLDVMDNRFGDDILSLDERGDPVGGLAQEIAVSTDRARTADLVKERLRNVDPDLGGHFRNYLARQLGRPELSDHILCWFPEDDLQIQYSRTGDGGDWQKITQGSQGQRSAALLAFLLAFGDEPLVLDQPEDDLDNHLIYDLIVRQIRENKLRRQLLIVTHNANIVVNGDAEMVHVLDYRRGQCRVVERGALQERPVREEVCRVMEGGHEAFERRWKRLGREV